MNSHSPIHTLPAGAQRLFMLLANNGRQGAILELLFTFPTGSGRCSLQHEGLMVDTETESIRQLVEADLLIVCREVRFCDNSGKVIGTTMHIGRVPLTEATHFQLP